jgi:hypothetical protein
MPEQATIEQSDIDDFIALLKEKNGPLPLEVLVERYVARLKDRVVAETDASTQNG